MGRWLTSFLDRVFAVICALLFAQFPLFMQQYEQQLFGHIDELSIQLNAIKNAAALSGKSLKEFTQRFIESGDVDFMRQGEIIEAMSSRFTFLSEGSGALAVASPFDKPLLFFNYFNFDVASSTFSHFQAGVPLSIEGVLYGFCGILFGYAFFFCIRRFASFLYRLFFSFEKEPAELTRIES